MQQATVSFAATVEDVEYFVHVGEELDENDPRVLVAPHLFVTCAHAHIPTESGGPTTWSEQ